MTITIIYEIFIIFIFHLCPESLFFFDDDNVYYICALFFIGKKKQTHKTKNIQKCKHASVNNMHTKMYVQNIY